MSPIFTLLWSTAFHWPLRYCCSNPARFALWPQTSAWQQQNQSSHRQVQWHTHLKQRKSNCFVTQWGYIYNRYDLCNVLCDQVPEKSPSCGQFKDPESCCFFPPPYWPTTAFNSRHIVQGLTRICISARLHVIVKREQSIGQNRERNKQICVNKVFMLSVWLFGFHSPLEITGAKS